MSHQLLPPDSPARCFTCHHPLPPISLPPHVTAIDPGVFAQAERVSGVPVDPVAPIDPTPEPLSVFLMGATLIVIGWAAKKWRRAKA